MRLSAARTRNAHGLGRGGKINVDAKKTTPDSGKV
jgi:hypothetical protein